MTRFGLGLAATLLSLFVAATTVEAESAVVDFGDAVPTMAQLRSALGRGGNGNRNLFDGKAREIFIQHTPGGVAPAPALPRTPAAAVTPTSPAAAPQQRTRSTAPPSSAPRGISMAIQFEYNSARVKQDYAPHIARIAEYLRTKPELRLVVVGHTDASGTATYNQRLSKERAQAVVAALRRQGVAPSHLRAEGRGETQPKVNDRYDARNRRVEFLINN